jgi:signal transduction histidine kinase/ActR/RegA family two-component response regulator
MKNNNKYIHTKHGVLDPCLTKQHFSTRIFKVYLKCIERHYPEVCVEGICGRAGLPYDYILDETNWVSVLFDHKFTAECIKATGDHLLPYRSGLISLTPEGMGNLYFHLTRYTLSTTKIYRTIPSQTLHFAKIMSMEIVAYGKEFIHIKYHPINLENLNDDEQKALIGNLENIYQNTIGYIASVPTIHNQQRAEVKHYSESGPNGIMELHMEVTYHDRKPIRRTVGLLFFVVSFIAGFVYAWSNKPDEIVLSELHIVCLMFGSLSIILIFVLLLVNYLRQRKIPEAATKVINKMDLQYRELQKTKEALRENEALLRKIVENYPNSFVLVIEKDSTIGFTSGLEFKKQNINPDTYVGRSLTEIYPDYADIFQEHFKKTLKGEECSFELIIKEQHFLYNTVPLYSEDGSIPRILVVIKNITERKQLESSIQQSQKMEAIGTLAGGIAHDFNNILCAMIGFTELTIDDVPKGSMAQDNLEEVLKSATRAKEMVQQILAFSRKSDTEKKPVRIQSIVKEALKLLRPSIPATIEIRQDIDENCGPVLADSTQIHQVVMNLATNAYHAMREKGGLLNFTLKKEIFRPDDPDQSLRPGTYLRLTVSDTGCGMDNVVMEKIFDPYFSTKGPGDGTGMGLAVVHGIIKEHGGDIEVQSEVGKGTTFNVSFPLIKTGSVEMEIFPAEVIPTGSEHILCIDDEKAIVLMTQQKLVRLGYKVTIRTSSEEALEAFKAKKDEFDLVISDMTMPNMTGVELAAGIKEIRPDIPIIICTGFSELIDKDIAKKIGISGFIMKPALKDEIAKTVRKVLDRQNED